MENETKPLILDHVFLVAKGWYKNSKYLWQDYKRAIICDGHYTPYSRNDVAYLLLKKVMEHKDKLLPWTAKDEPMLYMYNEIRRKMDLIQFINSRKNIKLDPIELYDNAVILVCNSIFVNVPTKDFDKICSPDSRVLPLNVREGETIKDTRIRIKDFFKNAKPYDSDDKYVKDFFKHGIKKYYSLKNAIKNNELIYEDEEAA